MWNFLKDTYSFHAIEFGFNLIFNATATGRTGCITGIAVSSSLIYFCCVPISYFCCVRLPIPQRHPCTYQLGFSQPAVHLRLIRSWSVLLHCTDTDCIALSLWVSPTGPPVTFGTFSVLRMWLPSKCSYISLLALSVPWFPVECLQTLSNACCLVWLSSLQCLHHAECLGKAHCTLHLCPAALLLVCLS